MKLRLPTALRSVICACAITACVTGTASADTYTDADGTRTYHSGDLDTQEQATNNNTNMLNASIPDSIDTIEFALASGGTKWLNSTATVAQDILISSSYGDETDRGLYITDGGGGTVYFQGDVTGDGVLHKSGKGKNSHLLFTGDVSAYTGAITLNSNSDVTNYIEFGGQWSDSSNNLSSAINRSEVVNNSRKTVNGTETTYVGVSGSGNISLGAARNNLVYNYDAKAAGDDGVVAPTYVTNIISGDGTLILAGSSDMVFTKSVDINALKVADNALSADGAGKITVTLQGTNNYSEFTNGVSVGRLGKLIVDTTGRTTYLGKGGLNMDALDVKSGTVMLKSTTANTVNDCTALGNVTVSKDAVFQAESTAHTLSFANNVTIMGGANGGDTQVTISKKAGAESWNTSGIIFRTLTNYAFLSTSGSAPELTNTKLDITGLVYANTIKLSSSEVVVNSGATYQTVGSSYIHTFNDSTLTVMGGTNGDDVQATFATKEGAESWTGQHHKFTTTTDNGKTVALIVQTEGGSYADLQNVDVTVKGELVLNLVHFTNSSITVQDDATLKAVTNIATLNELTVAEGGQLVAASSDLFKFTGNINLTLNAEALGLDELAALVGADENIAWNTSVLPGTMDEGSSLTLSFANDVTLPSSSDGFTLTFTGLKQGSNTLGIEDFTVNGLTEGWSLNAVEASGNNTMLTFAYSNSANIPEPTTATLSLLALAGLAARRRRK